MEAKRKLQNMLLHRSVETKSWYDDRRTTRHAISRNACRLLSLHFFFILKNKRYRNRLMEKHRSDHHHEGRGRRNRTRACFCSPRVTVSFVFRGIGRCSFITCYPVMQCFGWDDCRHDHSHKHFH